MMHIILFLIIIIPFTAEAVDTNAEQAIVMDYNTNEILYEKNGDQKIPPASMTKIMTVYIAFDRIKNTDLSIEHVCNISPKAYKMGGSRTFLEVDDQVSIEDLLKGIIVQSGNDASISLAECLSGTESDFANLMNVYAKKLDMENTNFINSSGWPEENHFSTVYDLAILSNALIRNFPNLYTYFKLKEFTYNEITQPNRNKLLTSLQGTDGLKTGYTKKSGWGIAASSFRDNRRIIIVISGTNSSRSRLNESSYLINWAFTQTSLKTLIHSGQIIKNVDVWLGNKPTVNLISNQEIISTLSFDQLQLFETYIEYNKPLAAPFKKGDKLGEITITIPGKKPIVSPLVAEIDVSEINPFARILAGIKYLVFGTSLDEI